MYRNIWRFQVKEGCKEDFCRMNTEDWPGLFDTRSDSYKCTMIAQDVDDKSFYLVIDQWESKEAFKQFLKENRNDYDKLDYEHSQLYETAEYVGYSEI